MPHCDVPVTVRLSILNGEQTMAEAVQRQSRAPACCSPIQVNLVERVRYLDRAEVAQRSGVAAATLRFYEEKG
jgi:hypothetical protein